MTLCHPFPALSDTSSLLNSLLVPLFVILKWLMSSINWWCHHVCQLVTSSVVNQWRHLCRCHNLSTPDVMSELALVTEKPPEPRKLFWSRDLFCTTWFSSRTTRGSGTRCFRQLSTWTPVQRSFSIEQIKTDFDFKTFIWVYWFR